MTPLACGCAPSTPCGLWWAPPSTRSIVPWSGGQASIVWVWCSRSTRGTLLRSSSECCTWLRTMGAPSGVPQPPAARARAVRKSARSSTRSRRISTTRASSTFVLCTSRCGGRSGSKRSAPSAIAVAARDPSRRPRPRRHPPSGSRIHPRRLVTAVEHDRLQHPTEEPIRSLSTVTSIPPTLDLVVRASAAREARDSGAVTPGPRRTPTSTSLSGRGNPPASRTGRRSHRHPRQFRLGCTPQRVEQVPPVHLRDRVTRPPEPDLAPWLVSRLIDDSGIGAQVGRLRVS